MKNTDYVIYMTTRGGRKWKYLKDDIGWKQMGPEGQLHRMTAEQFLNHLLPAAAKIKPVILEVVYKGTWKSKKK
jgi:hypothetical protein